MIVLSQQYFLVFDKITNATNNKTIYFYNMLLSFIE